MKNRTILQDNAESAGTDLKKKLRVGNCKLHVEIFSNRQGSVPKGKVAIWINPFGLILAYRNSDLIKNDPNGLTNDGRK